jgi:branched-chain amino acid transport system substrate-binding protein
MPPYHGRPLACKLVAVQQSCMTLLPRHLKTLTAALLATLALSAQAQTTPIKLAMIEGMSGPFANAGEAVLRNLRFAIERVNAAGGVKTVLGLQPLELMVLDNKGQAEESLVMLKAALERDALVVMQGNSSAVAGVLTDALSKHNARQPQQRALFLNYSAVDPVLTNEKCSPWHFRFDAHVDMRMAALVAQIAQDTGIKNLYLLNQDYAFGQQVAKSARAMVAALRPDIVIVGDELHPIGKIKDFAPYATKIKAAGADAVLTGNWGNDLTLFVKATKEVGLEANFYTFYGNGLGAPAALGDAGVDRVIAVSEWHSNASAGSAKTELDALYEAYRKRYPDAKDDYFNPRTVLMVDMLVKAIEQAGIAQAVPVAKALSGMVFKQNGFDATLRAADHQLIQALYVYRMGKQGSAGIDKGIEGSGYGFKTALRVPASALAHAHNCVMPRF